MDKYLEANRASWDARVPVHSASRFYDTRGFLGGKCSLLPLELSEVGPVRGRSVLHLQCHFGLDTLSWARRGARVTGADFSPAAIEKARELSAASGVPARFVLSDVYSLPRRLSGRFDIVYASYGVFCWIGDIRRWFRVAASFLKPGGFLYAADDHPFAGIFDAAGRKPEIDYFRTEPLRMPPAYTYTDGPKKKMPPTYEWWYTVSGLLAASREAGLRLDFFREHPFSAWRRFPGMKKGRDGLWRRAGEKLPLLFSLKAVKKPARRGRTG